GRLPTPSWSGLIGVSGRRFRPRSDSPWYGRWWKIVSPFEDTVDLHPDFSDLLVEFAHFGVRYALLGGYAVGVYAKPRATKDMDLLISGASDNLERVSRALAAFGAPAHVVEAARNMGSTERRSSP